MINPQYNYLRVERSQIKKEAGISDKGVVTSQHYVAAEAGADVLRKGGNAVDAAITAAFMLQTVEPWMTSLAACGYMLVMQPDGEVDVVEFTGRVPSQFDPEFYRPDESIKTFIGHPASVENRNVEGFTAAVVPGCVRGFAEGLKRFGTISFEQALQPVIERARKGLVVDWHTTLSISMAQADLSRDEGARQIFLPNGIAPEPGTVLPLENLTKTLETLSRQGPEALYGGEIGEKLVADLQKGQSPITLDDLVNYEAKIYKARSVHLQDKTLHMAGETSGAQRLIDCLEYCDARQKKGPVDAKMFTNLSEGLWEAFGAHRKRLNAAEQSHKTSTTQVNAVDADGRMVAITFTLLNRFGARALSPQTGILLNNGMSWFDPTPGRANSLTPNAYAPSNMCPVAVSDQHGGFAVYGAAGGNQIVPTLAQLSAFMLYADMDAEEAMNVPRISTGPSKDIFVNVDMPENIIEALASLSNIKLAQQTVFPRPFASPGMITRRHIRDGRGFVGMPDTTYPSAFAAIV